MYGELIEESGTYGAEFHPHPHNGYYSGFGSGTEEAR